MGSLDVKYPQISPVSVKDRQSGSPDRGFFFFFFSFPQNKWMEKLFLKFLDPGIHFYLCQSLALHRLSRV